jgi:VirE-like protein
MTPFDALRVQRFDNLYNTTPSATLSLADVLDSIVDGRYAAAIRRLRTVFTRQGEDAYRAAKQRLPQITFAGTFAPTRAKEHLDTHSEVCHADIDHLADLAETKARLQEDPHVLYIFTSPRGDGLKYGVRVTKVDNDEAYKHTWRIIADAHKAAYGVVWDESGKDICRLCFVSWDPACYINPRAEVYAVPPPMATPPPPRPTQRPATPTGPTDAIQRQGQRALETAIHMIEVSVPGQQHFARCRAAYLLGGFIGGGLLTYDEAYHALADPVLRTAKNVPKAMKDIADCLKAGGAKPITQADLEADWEQWRATQPHLNATTPAYLPQAAGDPSPPATDIPNAAGLLHHVLPDYLRDHPDPRVRRHWERIYRRTAQLKHCLAQQGALL